jgi:hypothetical protein
MCQRVTIAYDTNSIDTTFSQNAWGRPTTTQWGGSALFRVLTARMHELV